MRLKKLGVWIGAGLFAISGASAFAQDSESDSPAAIQAAIARGQAEAASGRFFTAATTFFNAYTLPGGHQDTALAWLAESLIRGGFPNAGSYFFIKVLQTGNKSAMRRVLPFLPYLLENVGGDLLRKYVVKFTSEGDYDANTKSHFFYFLGKDELLKGDPQKALSALGKVSSGAGILTQAFYLRATAHAMLGQNQQALNAFATCRSLAGKAESKSRLLKNEFFDLEARCAAGLARTYYQAGSHDKAEDVYDEIPKASFVWTDVLFEQAWNAYAKNDYNKALGKLVTYRSPSLKFVFNPEVDILRAQSFLALCHYDDVNKTVNEFNATYAGVGAQMKNFLLANDRNLGAFYQLARATYYKKLHTDDMLARALNRFIRGPYFASQLFQERLVAGEMNRLRSLSKQQGSQKFEAFLEKVVAWRNRTVQMLGGLFVRNSLYDIYQDLLADLDRMSYIKLEMLNRSKNQLVARKSVMSEDEDGVFRKGKADIDRKDYQYFWTFNGEFWADELGDYVFALESQCGS